MGKVSDIKSLKALHALPETLYLAMLDAEPNDAGMPIHEADAVLSPVLEYISNTEVLHPVCPIGCVPIIEIHPNGDVYGEW